jgi:hypothetical protein
VPYWQGIPQGQLSEDARFVRDACQDLQRSRDRENTTIDDGILSARAETLVESLSYTTLLKLSLITWHFGSPSASSDLACFLRQPSHNAVWETVHDRYQRLMQEAVPFREFKASHDFLLCPILGSASNRV